MVFPNLRPTLPRLGRLRATTFLPRVRFFFTEFLANDLHDFYYQKVHLVYLCRGSTTADIYTHSKTLTPGKCKNL